MVPVHVGETDSWFFVQINFNITDKTFVNARGVTIHPMNEAVFPCNVGLTDHSSGCSCQDCRDSCIPIPPPPPPSQPFTILFIDGYVFIMGCVYLAFLAAFCSYSVCYNVIVQVGRSSFTLTVLPACECSASMQIVGLACVIVCFTLC